MSKLYRPKKIFVSRAYYHGGGGLEDLGLRFFRSQEEYDQTAKEKGWFDDSPSFKSSWCVKPREVEVMIESRHAKAFEAGKPLDEKKVAIPVTSLAEVNTVHL